MDLELIARLLDEYGIPLAAIAILTGAVGWLMTRLLSEMEKRTKRSEDLVDTFKPSIDAHTDAVEALTVAVKEHTAQGTTQTAVLNALLEEWRRAK